MSAIAEIVDPAMPDIEIDECLNSGHGPDSECGPSISDDNMYGELHRIAVRLMAAEQAGHTLQPTALVNEAWLRMNKRSPVATKNRKHFVAIASTQMRRALIDHSRKRNAAKRPSNGLRLTLNQYEHSDGFVTPSQTAEILDICLAIEKLEQRNKRHAQVFELRYLGGLSVADCAAHVNVAERTIKSDWKFASAWIARYLELS